MANDDILSVAQVAAEFNVTPQTIRAWIRDGKLRAARVGKSIHILRGDVYAMLETAAIERRPPPAPDIWDEPARELDRSPPASDSEPATMWAKPGEGPTAVLVPRQPR
jgi:excisionase family DNA binding protein